MNGTVKYLDVTSFVTEN